MNESLPINTTRKLIELRNLLDRISQISWAFSVYNKKHPISEVKASDADFLVSAYEDLLKETSGIIGQWQK